MDTFFKKIGDDIAGAAEQAEIDATVERELAASMAEIEEQAEEEVEITPEDPGLEIADAGKRPEEMRTQEEIRDYNRRVIEVNNAIKERNLEEGNKPTEAPEESSYGKRRRKRKYGSNKKKKAGKRKKAGKKKKKAGKKKRRTSVIKGVKGAARNVTKTAKKVGRGATKTVKKVGKGAKKVVKRVGKGVDRIAKGLRSIFAKKRSFGRSATPMPMYLEDYEKVQGYDPRELVMQSLFGKRKKKFGMCEDCSHKFGKRRRYKFGAGCHGKETFGTKCIGQCSECGSSITGFDPMAIVQKKLSYGKKRRKKKKFGGCGGSCGFGKKVSKKPSAATRKMCKRLKVRMTLKRGGKRVYKSEKMLKKQCKTAMKRKKKTVKRRKRSFGKKKRKVRRRFGTTADIERWKKQADDRQKEIDEKAMKALKQAGIKYGLPALGIGALGGTGYLGYKAYKGRKKKKTVKRRKRKSSFGKKAKKPSAALRKLCKKHKVRLTVKRGKKRVYKSEAMLKKQCKKAMEKKKKKTVKRKSRGGHAFGRKRKGSKKLTNFQKFSKWCNNNEVACTAAMTPLAVGIPMGMTHAYNKYYVDPYNAEQRQRQFESIQRNTYSGMN